ncbi:MAG: septation protein A [Burkholderiales bacterium]|jgi:intracellular septation protein|nr:septation protein A [Burkholderiales bacterium]
MSFLIDFLPLILFFGTYKFYGIFTATAVAIIASVVQFAYLYCFKTIGVVHWISLGVIVIFGGATLVLQDPVFIQWKPTVIYLAFAAMLIGGKLFWRRDFLRHVMKGIELPDAVWSKLTWAWSALFIFLAALNRYVAVHYSMDTWVDFKVWGTSIILLVFAVAQGLFIARYLKES